MTEELYLEDSYLKTCSANIIEINDGTVILDKTVFYPSGGGQECDHGHIIQNGQEFEVHKVKKEGGKIRHYVREAERLIPGPAEAVIDWERRENLMRHHTMLHVLAAVFHKEYGSLCTGNQIYPEKARIDLTDITELDRDEINRIVALANQEVKKNHPVSARTFPREEAEAISGAIKTVVNLIPKAVKEIRLVKIGEIDEQACGGTHVKGTEDIGEIVLDKTKNKGKGTTRLELRAVTKSVEAV
ncbi:alanyl-tRNA editing protein [Evansella clarkii]|uniref:alanyl-tRNA editing protein n=1 Tax=Evansella clarkii TaxID=79879 RepID=UPI000B44283F|nr:alanyl-tRNA editing protein [Evansella clarkii]